MGSVANLEQVWVGSVAQLFQRMRVDMNVIKAYEISRGVGVGYTLATGRMFGEFSAFHNFCELLLERQILTHEFGNENLWTELREKYESIYTNPVPF